MISPSHINPDYCHLLVLHEFHSSVHLCGRLTSRQAEMAERVRKNKDKECYSAGVFLALEAWMQKKKQQQYNLF